MKRKLVVASDVRCSELIQLHYYVILYCQAVVSSNHPNMLWDHVIDSILAGKSNGTQTTKQL